MYVGVLLLQGVVESDSIQVEGKSTIRLTPSFKAKGAAVKRRPQWPSSTGNFLKFVLAKENCDTMYAASSLARYLRCNNETIKYAGTKDKRVFT